MDTTIPHQSFDSCIKKQKEIQTLFQNCMSSEEKYQKIIEIGRKLPSLPENLKIDDNIVKGCQSLMYLHSSVSNGLIHFSADSEALISKGLAALLLLVYSEEPPEAVLLCPPRFLEELGIHHSLSPSRSNGLASLFLKMKQEAIKALASQSPTN